MTRNIFSSWKGSIIEYTKWFSRRWGKEKSVPSGHIDFGNDEEMQRKIFDVTESVFEYLRDVINNVEEDKNQLKDHSREMSTCMETCAERLDNLIKSLSNEKSTKINMK